MGFGRRGLDIAGPSLGRQAQALHNVARSVGRLRHTVVQENTCARRDHSPSIPEAGSARFAFPGGMATPRQRLLGLSTRRVRRLCQVHPAKLPAPRCAPADAVRLKFQRTGETVVKKK